MLCKNAITRGWIYNTYKRLFDVTISGISLLLLSPLFVLIAVIIKIEDGGDILHKRICVGKNNKVFVMYKFRSMCSDADNIEKYFHGEELEKFLRGDKTINDPRITRVGKFLRQTSIDELPQLFSVFSGNMSLVGPRPVIEREAAFYGVMRDYLLSIRPGITGWWQINGRDNIPYLSDEAKALQLYYDFNRKIMLDIKNLAKTVLIVLKREAAR